MLRLATTVDIKTPVNRLVGAYGLPPIPCMEPVYPFGAGEPHVGGVLNAFLQPPGPYGMRFKPRVVTVVLQREFRWRGTLLFSRLFQGEHFFLLEPVSLNQRGSFTGKFLQGSWCRCSDANWKDRHYEDFMP